MNEEFSPTDCNIAEYFPENFFQQIYITGLTGGERIKQ